MCGIVGYIAKGDKVHESAREKFFVEGLVMDTLRGWDSTGVVWVQDEFSVGTMRTTQAGPAFVRNKKFIETDTNGWACIGHNRAATLGKVTTGNAHPFRYGSVAMVHNGTLTDHGRSLPHSPKKRLAVDSAMIAYNLSIVRPENAHEIIGKLRGAYALAWTDDRDSSINFARNHERPFHFASINSGMGMYFMSEAGMLRALSDRQRQHATKIDQIFKLDAHKHLKFKKGSLVPEVTKIVPFVEPRAPYQNAYTPRANRTYADQWKDTVRGMKTTSGTKTDTDSTGPASGDVVPLARDARGWHNGKMRDASALLMDAAFQLYQIKPHTRVGFNPKQFVEWGDTGRGYVLGSFYHPEWGNTEWEGIVHGINKSWISEARMSRIWGCNQIGLGKSFNKGDNTGMQPLLLQVRTFNFDYEEIVEQEEEDAPEMFWGPDNTLIGQKEMQKLLDYGCGYCTCDLKPEEHEDIEWADDTPLCLDCQTLLTDPKFEGGLEGYKQ